MSKKVENGENVIDIKGINKSGVYFAVVRDGKNKQTKRFSIIR